MRGFVTGYPFWISFLALIALLSASRSAQTTSTEIFGLVTDATGAVVPGATVSVTRVATGETRTDVTNQAGKDISLRWRSASRGLEWKPADSTRNRSPA
jgi:hypothetical protein